MANTSETTSDMALALGERKLMPKISPELVVLSYCISWLGAYTSIQIHIHALSASSRVWYWMWTALASVAFGFCAIWSMHFLGMLACEFDVSITFNKPLIILSAIAATLFTFAASLSNDGRQARAFRQLFQPLTSLIRWKPFGHGNAIDDVEYAPLKMFNGDDDEEEEEDDNIHRVDPDLSEANGRRSKIRISDSSNLEGRDDEQELLAESVELPQQRGWTPWFSEIYAQITIFHFLRAVILAGAIVSMFYLAMWAMQIQDGRIAWHPSLMLLSYLFTLVLSFLSCIAMLQMELHPWRQVLVATLSATSICSMHYFGMEAATMYSSSPPTPPGTTAGFPAYLTWTIITTSILICILANALLANRALVAQRRTLGMIKAQKKMWKLRAEKEAAERGYMLKQQFISVASHEIRTPLHTIAGYAELLARTEMSKEQRVYLGNIRMACHAVNVIAENVLDFSKLERENVEVEAKPSLVDPRQLVESVARLASGSVEDARQGKNAKQVDTVIWVGEDVPRMVWLDETYALRVLMNLYSNAAKFTEEGYISVSVDCCANRSPSSNNTNLVFSVQDTGIGIPPSHREAIFEPFRQADSSLTRQHYGAGLGLSIVKHLVARLKGTIVVESVLGPGSGSGSRFEVVVPVGTVADGDVPGPLSLPTSPTMKRVKIILSDSRTEKLYVELWRRMGYEASMGSPRDRDIASTDVIWTDADSITRHPSLADLLASSATSSPSSMTHADSKSCLSPVICIVYWKQEELVKLGEGVKADNAMLVKQPVVMHSVAHSLAAFALRRGASSANGYMTSAEEKERATGTADEMDLRAGRANPPSIIELPPAIAVVSVPNSPVLEIPPHGARKVVLLVEDNMINQQLGVRLVEKLGYRVLTANNGQEAIDVLMGQRVDKCLMDCQMPVMDGFTASEKIRKLEETGALIGRLWISALTANVNHESEERCRASGMDHFLPKPLRLDALQSALALS